MRYTLFWKDGTRQTVQGLHIAEACDNAGIGKKALVALDFYTPIGDDTSHIWDATKNKWLDELEQEAIQKKMIEQNNATAR